ncbi:MAG TPA: polyhydroxyalkanoic acid system family protein [Allosphingosinicella sp.]|nr:polyhydroxyalkanoic acid system family protein [Allosphingosinicella sp.]
MSQQVSADITHSLGAAEAKRRIETNLGSLLGKLPAGAVVRPHWDGNRVTLDLVVLSQAVEAEVDIQETVVRITVKLPPALAFFGQALGKALRQTGSVLLKDDRA